MRVLGPIFIKNHYKKDVHVVLSRAGVCGSVKATPGFVCFEIYMCIPVLAKNLLLDIILSWENLRLLGYHLFGSCNGD